MGLVDWARRLASRHEASPAPVHRATELPGDPAKRGVDFLAAGDLPAAREAFRQALALNPQSAANHVNLAYVLQQAGAEEDALPHLRRAAAIDPHSFDAHYMLAGALERLPDLQAAAKHLHVAVSLQPDFDPARADLCRVLALGGDTIAARAAITEALERSPANADFHHHLGNVFMAESMPAAAQESYRRAIELRPDHALMHSNLGLALHAQGRYEDAVQSFERAIALDVGSAEAHANLGSTRRAQGRLAEAATSLQRAAELRPDDAETLNSYGNVLQELGQLDRAIASYRRAIELRPELPGAYANLGLVLEEKGELGEAVATYRRGLQLGSVASLHDNLAIALQKMGRLDEAIEHFRKALAIRPDNVNTRCNLAATLGDALGPQAAIAAYREILDVQPDHLIARNSLLFNLSAYGDCGPESYLEEARRFDSMLTRNPLEPPAVRANRQRLRLGFVSGDLRAHPVGFFIEGILNHIDKARFELFAYPTNAREDELTRRIKPLFAQWRLLKGQDDKTAAASIRSDEIDILIDLAGHSGDNRLAAFAYRPAPVQVSWLGFFASTGMAAMDYVLADDVCVPHGHDRHFSERVWRLPRTRLCFTPPAGEAVPAVSVLPALERGHVTFGCFQRLGKVNDAVLALWGRVFEALPSSRLLLQSHQTGQKAYVEQILEKLSRVGISAERVTVLAPAHRSFYLQSYAEVDMVLDTFPFTGGTTTCEALWMGVPTLTLAGETMIARQGVAMMRAADLDDWVADDAEAYVRKAVNFSNDVPGLARLRASLRERVSTTPLFDVQLFARNLEQALAGMWQDSSGNKSS